MCHLRQRTRPSPEHAAPPNAPSTLQCHPRGSPAATAASPRRTRRRCRRLRRRCRFHVSRPRAGSRGRRRPRARPRRSGARRRGVGTAAPRARNACRREGGGAGAADARRRLQRRVFGCDAVAYLLPLAAGLRPAARSSSFLADVAHPRTTTLRALCGSKRSRSWSPKASTSLTRSQSPDSSCTKIFPDARNQVVAVSQASSISRASSVTRDCGRRCSNESRGRLIQR